MSSIGAVVLLPRLRQPLQQRRDADASDMPCAASLLQCSTVVSKLVFACCHAVAVAAPCMLLLPARWMLMRKLCADWWRDAASECRRLEQAPTSWLSTQVRLQVMPAAAAAQRRCHSSMCAASLVAAIASSVQPGVVHCYRPRKCTQVTLASAAACCRRPRVSAAAGPSMPASCPCAAPLIASSCQMQRAAACCHTRGQHGRSRRCLAPLQLRHADAGSREKRRAVQPWRERTVFFVASCCHAFGAAVTAAPGRYSSAGMPMPAICHAPPRGHSSAAPWCPNPSRLRAATLVDVAVPCMLVLPAI